MSEDYEYLEKICDCGERKDVKEAFCNECQKGIQEEFKNIIKSKFYREEVEYLDKILDGEWIADFVFGGN